MKTAAEPKLCCSVLLFLEFLIWPGFIISPPQYWYIPCHFSVLILPYVACCSLLYVRQWRLAFMDCFVSEVKKWTWPCSWEDWKNLFHNFLQASKKAKKKKTKPTGLVWIWGRVGFISRKACSWSAFLVMRRPCCRGKLHWYGRALGNPGRLLNTHTFVQKYLTW